MAGGGASPAGDGPGQEVVGKEVKKKFGTKNFSGTIESFDPDEKWYTVKYSDGDAEEVDWAELSGLIAAAEKSPKSPRAKAPAAKAPAAKKAKVAPAPPPLQTVGGKRVATGGPGQGKNVAKRVSVAAATWKKPGRPRKNQQPEIPEGGGRDAIGRRVRKKFEEIGAYYSGKVTAYDPNEFYYKVEYDDGDAEEMEWDELIGWMLPPENGNGTAGTSAGAQAPDFAAVVHAPTPTPKKPVLEIRKRRSS